MRILIPMIIALTLPAIGWSQSGADVPDQWPELVEAVESAASIADGDRLGRLASGLSETDLEPARWRDYWIAYAAYRHGLFSDDERLAEAAYEHCAEAAEAAIEHGERSGESEALRGACYSQLAGGGPMAGMRYGSRSSVAIDTALTDAPDNPRALMIGGSRDLYTPVQWGGDIERAVRRLERALDRFEAERKADRSNPWQPRWGRMDAFGHLAIAYGRLDRDDQARRVLDRAEEAGIESPWLDSIGRGLADGDG